MALEGLKAVVAQYEANPEKANGFSSGGYSIDYDKIWRGNVVVGYTNPDKKDASNPDIPSFLPTSRTSPEEGQCFVAAKAVAPPEPASPPMSISSPEGAASEEKSAPEPSAEAPAASPPPSGEAKDLGELGPEISAEEEEAPKEANPEHFQARKKEPGVDPLGLSRETAPARENLEVLASARLEETRRKYFNATASLQFDIEAKAVTGGESVCLYLLPIIRPEGKYELYDFTVTKTSAIPSAYAVRQAVAASVAEAMPHVTVNRSQLEMIARRVYSAMKGAKDDLGGFRREESITEAIDRYFMEDF
jgi:hypothetical protein